MVFYPCQALTVGCCFGIFTSFSWHGVFSELHQFLLQQSRSTRWCHHPHIYTGVILIAWSSRYIHYQSLFQPLICLFFIVFWKRWSLLTNSSFTKCRVWKTVESVGRLERSWHQKVSECMLFVFHVILTSNIWAICAVSNKGGAYMMSTVETSLRMKLTTQYEPHAPPLPLWKQAAGWTVDSEQ